MNLFGFLADVGNAEARKVGRWLDPDGSGDRMVSTMAVSDGSLPYETAFQHPAYNGGDMVIVEAYHNLAAAERGHARWVETMTRGPLPDKLADCLNSGISQLCYSAGGEFTHDRTPA